MKFYTLSFYSGDEPDLLAGSNVKFLSKLKDFYVYVLIQYSRLNQAVANSLIKCTFIDINHIMCPKVSQTITCRVTYSVPLPMTTPLFLIAT